MDSPDKIINKIEYYIQQDPGNRGLANWAVQGSLASAMRSLLEAKEVFILTGFYILDAGAIETDGPLGAVVLAGALEKLNKKVAILTDWHAKETMQMAIDTFGLKTRLLAWQQGNMPPYETVQSKELTHIIALERPGRAVNGKYHNFRGKDISDWVLPFDDYYERAEKEGVVTIGIGDGGNELGMGAVADSVANVAPHDHFACPIKSTYCICAGVSNWGGYGSAAALSILGNKSLLPSFEVLNAVLKTIVEAGVVDGVSGKAEATVDGLPLSVEKGVYDWLLEQVNFYLSKKRSLLGF